jgi:pimeloyl-ACP methyl ester carboxylesterase
MAVRLGISSNSRPGILHLYWKRLSAFEHARPLSSSPPKHTLLFVAGLGDGLLTVKYPTVLAQSLPSDWSVVEVSLLSSYNGWGTGSLQRDVREISEAVQFFRNLRPADGKIVLMGHSTGCQDAMEYVSGKGAANRAAIDGIILQAPVSDREGKNLSPEHEKSLQVAQQFKDDGKEDDVLPLSAVSGLVYGRAAVTAYRWLSLLVFGGDDDYFSSDLPDQKLRSSFGAFKKSSPLLILWSGADEHAPSHLDSTKLMARWTEFVRQGGGIVDSERSGVVADAHHNLNGDPDRVVEDLARRVTGYLQNIESRSFQTATSQL